MGKNSYGSWIVVLTLLVLLPVFSYIVAVKRDTSSHKLMSLKREDAIVTKVIRMDTDREETTRSKDTKGAIYQGYLRLPKGEEIQIPLVPPVPKVGESVPIIVEHYSDGRTLYNIDRIRWLRKKAK